MVNENPIATAVMELMRDGRPRTINDIRYRVKYHPDDIKTALRTLVRRKQLSRTDARDGGLNATIYDLPGDA